MQRSVFAIVVGLSLVAAATPLIEAQQVTLDFLISGDPEYLEKISLLVEEFERRNPAIDVNMIEGDDEKLRVMIAGGTPPDVARMNDTTPIELGLRGHLMAIAPLAAKDPAIDLSDFFPASKAALTWDNVLYGLPLGVSLYLPLVNVDLFESYGVPIPDENWAWDQEVISHGKKLTLDRNGDGTPEVFFTGPFSYNNWDMLYYMSGERSLVDGRVNWDTPRAMEALQFAADIALVHGIAPVPASDGETYLFEQGRRAFSLEGSWKIGILRDSDLPFDWAVAKMPSYKGHVGTRLWNETPLGILTSTEHPQEAWKLFTFLAGPEGQRITAQLGLAMPASGDVATAFTDTPPPPENLAYALTLASSMFNSQENPMVPGWNSVSSSVVGPEIDKVFSGEAPAEAVLGEVTARINDAIEEFLSDVKAENE